MADEIAKMRSVHVDPAIADVVTMQIQPWKPSPPFYLQLQPCGVKIDLETGEVVIPEGLALTDAAKAFWDAVQHISGYRPPGFW